MAFRSRCSKSGAVFGGEGPFGPHLPLSEKKWGLCGAPTVLVDGGYWKGGGEYRGISSLNRQQLYRTTIGFSTANTEFISICLESRCKRVIIGRRADIVDTQNTIYLKCFSVCHQFVMDHRALLLLRFLLTVKKSPVFLRLSWLQLWSKSSRCSSMRDMKPSAFCCSSYYDSRETWPEKEVGIEPLR